MWDNRGLALSDLGRYAEAVESYDKAIAINPNYILAKQNREIASKNKPNPHRKWSKQGDIKCTPSTFEIRQQNNNKRGKEYHKRGMGSGLSLF